MKINKSLNIDLNIISPQKNIRIHEGDVDSVDIVIAVSVEDNSTDLTGVTIKYDATINNYLAEQDADGFAENNIITIPVTKNMTSMSGKLLIDIRMIAGNEILYTQTICANVEKAIVNGSTYIDFNKTTILRRMKALEDEVDSLDDTKVDKSMTIAGIDLKDDITAEELKSALDIEISAGATILFEIFAPPYYVSDNDYCKVGDIWVDKDISTGQGYRVSVLMSKTYIADPGVYYCSWQPVVHASFEANALPSGGNLPSHRYSESDSSSEYSYPQYRNGDILTVGGSEYECSVSDGSDSYTARYTYSFKHIVSEADISGKMNLALFDPTSEDIEALPRGQWYYDTAENTAYLSGGEELSPLPFFGAYKTESLFQKKIYKLTALFSGSHDSVPFNIGDYVSVNGVISQLKSVRTSSMFPRFYEWYRPTQVFYRSAADPIEEEHINKFYPSADYGFEAYSSPTFFEGDYLITNNNQIYKCTSNGNVHMDGNDYYWRYSWELIYSSYTKNEIDSMIGDIESLLAEV